MREKLFKFLFGDKPIPEEMSKALFKDEWRAKENALCERIAELIVEMVPSGCCNSAMDRYHMTQSISTHIRWAHPEVLEALAEQAPIPLRTENEFIHFLCEYILVEKGGSL